MRHNWYKFPWFRDWLDGTGSIPEIYYNVFSEEQRIKFLCCELQKLIEYCEKMGMEINLFTDALDELEDLFQKFQESGFEDYYEKQLEEWINNNAALLFEKFAKQVFFGLTSDGYFCAYVPESWDDIEFDTGYIFGQFDYGRLILRYNVEGSGVIDNTGRYDELNTNLLKTMRTLYAPMREGGDI